MVSFTTFLFTTALAAQTAFAQSCFGSGGTEDVSASQVRAIAMRCQQLGGTISSGSNPITWNWGPIHPKISWISGCSGGPQQIANPVAGANCADLLYNNYVNCNNGGAGGYTDAACVRYELRIS